MRRMGRKRDPIPEIEVVFKSNLSYEEQAKRIERVNEIFVDIATDYHIKKIKEKNEELKGK